MQQEEPTSPGRQAVALGDPLDAIHAYVGSLDRVLVRAHDLGIDAARQALEDVSRPAGLPTGHLLERKRRELNELFDVARYQHLALPGVALADWLAFFFQAADMLGADAVHVVWGGEGQVSVAVADGARYRQAMAGRTLSELRELNVLAPPGVGQVSLDAGREWLAIAGSPWLFRQLLRELDGLTRRAPVAIALSYEPGREVLEGAMLPVRLVVHNHSTDVLVLEDLATDHAYDPRDTFIHVSLGHLVRDVENDRYVYDAVASVPTDAAFRTSILEPGEQRTMVMPLKLLEGGEAWRTFVLRYYRYSEAAFQRAAYVPLPGPVSGYPPRVIYGPIARLAPAAFRRHQHRLDGLRPGLPGGDPLGASVPRGAPRLLAGAGTRAAGR